MVYVKLGHAHEQVLGALHGGMMKVSYPFMQFLKRGYIRFLNFDVRDMKGTQPKQPWKVP